MKTRKWIGTVLITLVIVAVLAAGGYALYRYGYMRGAIAANAGEGYMFHDFGRMPYPGGPMGEGFMFHDFEDMPFPGGRRGDLPEGFQGRFDMPYCGVNPRGAPFSRTLSTHSVFSPFTILLRVLFLGLIVWGFYKIIKLFTGSRSWQLSFNSQVEPDPEAEAKPKGRATKK
jgi:hypothetical protein